MVVLLSDLRPFGEKEKDLHPTRTHSYGSLGTKVCDFCGATQLGDCSPTRRRANTRLSLVTGEKPVGLYRLLASRPPFAVHSARPSLLPSHQPATLWERRKPSLIPLHLWFAALNLAQAYAPDRRFVKRANALFPLFTNMGGCAQASSALST